MNQPSKEEHAKKQAVEQPNRDDVHEQREHEQPAEGIVTDPKAPKEEKT